MKNAVAAVAVLAGLDGNGDVVVDRAGCDHHARRVHGGVSGKPLERHGVVEELPMTVVLLVELLDLLQLLHRRVLQLFHRGHCDLLESAAGLRHHPQRGPVDLVKQAVGEFAAVIRSKREPEPYNGKGIKYLNEQIIRKQGKVFGS